MTSAHTVEVPTNGDENNVNPLTTGGKVMFAQAGFVVGLRFWVPATNTGTYTVGFYETTADDVPIQTGTGTLLASTSVAAAAVTASGWAEVPVLVPVSVGVVYMTARHSSSGRYVFSAGVFTAAGISNGGVTLIQDGINPNPPNLGVMRNMTFNEGAALAYPDNQFGQPDYFSDVNFSLTIPVTAGGAHTHGHFVNRSAIPMMNL